MKWHFSNVHIKQFIQVYDYRKDRVEVEGKIQGVIVKNTNKYYWKCALYYDIQYKAHF